MALCRYPLSKISPECMRVLKYLAHTTYSNVATFYIGATSFFRKPSCRMSKFRPSLYQKLNKNHIFEMSFVRHTKCSTSHFSEI